jgi:AcrR family transcriptional regulator
MKITPVRDEEEKKSKRQNILEAAFVVFSQKGFHKATIDDIIALADTGKGTVYNYFTNKEQLFFTLLEERERPSLVKLMQVSRSADEPLQKLEQMIRIQLDFLAENTRLWQILMHELRALCQGPMANEDERRRESCRKQFDERVFLFAKVMDEGRQAGVIKYPDVEGAAYMLFSIILGTALHTGGEYDVDDRAASIKDLFFHGVAK